MKLAALHLNPFGVFEDLTLELVPGRVHLVLGANEAGKSTCHAALGAHLFGWSRRRESVALMRGALTRVGLRWRDDEREHNMVRTANQKVVDHRGQSRDYQELFLPFSQSDYQTLFSLDHVSLRDGGALLGDQAGSLREALFAAAKSGEELHRVRGELLAREAELYRPKGKVLPLNRALAQLRELQEKARDASSKPQVWAQGAAALRDAETLTATLTQALATQRAREAHLEIVCKLHEPALKLAELDAELQRVPGMDLELNASALLERLSALDAEMSRLERECADLQARLATLDVAETSAEPTQAEPLREEQLDALHAAWLAESEAHTEAQRTRAQRARLREELAQLGDALVPPSPTAAEWRARERHALAAQHERHTLRERREAHERAVRALTTRASSAEPDPAAQLEALRCLTLPGRVEALALVAKHDELETLARRAEDDLAHARAEVSQLRHELGRMDRNSPVPSEEHLQNARKSRDALVGGDRELLRAAIAYADQLADAMRHGADRVAERAAKAEGLAKSELLERERERELERRRQHVQHSEAQLRALLPTALPRELPRWAALREEAIELHIAGAEIAERERALPTDSGDPSALAIHAEAAERAEREHAQWRARREDLELRLREAEQHLAAADDALTVATARKEHARRAAGAPIEELDAWIRTERRARGEWERRRAQAEERESTRHRDRSAWRAELAAREEQLRHARAEAESMQNTLDCTSRADALALLSIASQRQALHEQRTAEHNLARRIAAPLDPAPLLTEASARPRATLHAELEQIRGERLELEQQLEDARRDEAGKRVGYQQMQQANHVAANHLAEAAAKQAEATALATQWLSARLGARLLDRALERYRQEHQDPVLGHASRLFEVLTGGRYTKILPELGDGKEPIRLAARNPSGESVLASNLSEGTRDQLYLALRLGTLHARAAASSLPLPIVLDDVFVNFDDERTARGLTLIAELLPLTDVVYFTHHQRVLELATQVLTPEQLDVVRLPAPRAPQNGFSPLAQGASE